KIWHPDRFGGNPRLQRKAQEKLKQLNLAYKRLQLRLTSSAAARQGVTPQHRDSPPPPRPQSATIRSPADERPGVPGKWLRASSPAWFVLASLSAVVLASSLLIERPTTPESGGNPSAPRPESPISPEVRDLPDKMAPARRPAGGVEIRRGSTPPRPQRPDCPPAPNPHPNRQAPRRRHTNGKLASTTSPG